MNENKNRLSQLDTTVESARETGLSKLFLFGVFLLISNFIVGKIAIPLFAINFYLGLGVYLFSWLMLGAGLCLSGKRGWCLAKAWYSNKKTQLKKSIRKQF